MYESYIKKLNHDIEKIDQEECELMSKEMCIRDRCSNPNHGEKQRRTQCKTRQRDEHKERQRIVSPTVVPTEVPAQPLLRCV